MNYREIEENALTQEGLEVILNEVSPSFEMIQGFTETLKEPDLNGSIIAELMKQSNGIWDELNTYYAILDTVKSNKELTHFHTQKMQIEKSGGKFNASATEGEASAMTSDLRRVRNIIGAYRDSAEKNITTGQSLLSYIKESSKASSIQQG